MGTSRVKMLHKEFESCMPMGFYPICVILTLQHKENELDMHLKKKSATNKEQHK